MKLNSVLDKVTESTLEALFDKLDEKIFNICHLLKEEAMSELQLQSKLSEVKKELERVNSVAAAHNGRIEINKWKSFVDKAREWKLEIENQKSEIANESNPKIKQLFALLTQQLALLLSTLKEKQNNLIKLANDGTGVAQDALELRNQKAAFELQKSKISQRDIYDPNQLVNSKV